MSKEHSIIFTRFVVFILLTASKHSTMIRQVLMQRLETIPTIPVSVATCSLYDERVAPAYYDQYHPGAGRLTHLIVKPQRCLFSLMARETNASYRLQFLLRLAAFAGTLPVGVRLICIPFKAFVWGVNALSISIRRSPRFIVSCISLLK